MQDPGQMFPKGMAERTQGNLDHPEIEGWCEGSSGELGFMAFSVLPIGTPGSPLLLMFHMNNEMIEIVVCRSSCGVG